eukprot:3457971-Prymnesium_polylepis.2
MVQAALQTMVAAANVGPGLCEVLRDSGARLMQLLVGVLAVFELCSAYSAGESPLVLALLGACAAVQLVDTLAWLLGAACGIKS